MTNLGLQAAANVDLGRLLLWQGMRQQAVALISGAIKLGHGGWVQPMQLPTDYVAGLEALPFHDRRAASDPPYIEVLRPFTGLFVLAFVGVCGGCDFNLSWCPHAPAAPPPTTYSRPPLNIL